MPPDFILTALARDPAVVRMAAAAGVNRIGIDIERIGKQLRQNPGGDFRYSDHELDDLAAVARHAGQAKLFVRLNPLHGGSKAEIGRALESGAGVLMLPYFSTPCEAGRFIEMVAGRAETVLLVETAEAAARIREIAAVPGVQEIMIGLNDLHMSLGLSHPFEVLTCGAAAAIAEHVHAAGLRFGFGGVARVDDRSLPVAPDLVYAQYALLGGRAAWLARSFYRGIDTTDIPAAVLRLRERLAFWFAQPVAAPLEQRTKLESALRSMEHCRK